MADSSNDHTAANRAFFDDLAAKYDIHLWQKQMSLQITTFIQENMDFIDLPSHSKSKTLLDYACGTGMISCALGPYVDSILGIDLSPKMVERYNQLATTSPIPSMRKARAVEGNLLIDQEPSADLNALDSFNFDVAAIGLGLHHFPDHEKAIERLAQRLGKSGVLLIVDFVEEDQAWVPSHADHTIHKHGFSEMELKGLMEKHGLGGFGWKELPERLELRLQEDKPFFKRGFLARAAKT